MSLEPISAAVCTNCNELNQKPVFVCPYCGHDEFTDKELSGKGSVYTYTNVHMGFGEMAEHAPYSLAIIELDEGLRLTSVIEDNKDVESMKIGVKVELSGYNKDKLPLFKLA